MNRVTAYAPQHGKYKVLTVYSGVPRHVSRSTASSTTLRMQNDKYFRVGVSLEWTSLLLVGCKCYHLWTQEVKI